MFCVCINETLKFIISVNMMVILKVMILIKVITKI